MAAAAASASQRQTSLRGPATPAYVFRGHSAQIHSVRFVRRNTCLVSGDADGWVVVWRLESKRPLAVWHAHDGSLLGTAEWGYGRLITHGRDNTLRIWQLPAGPTPALSTVLPADGAATDRPKPWLLHALPVNTLNFCAFSMCPLRQPSSTTTSEGHHAAPPHEQPILVAVPAVDDQRIDVYQFPDEKLVAVVPRAKATETGMVMAVKLVLHQPSGNTLVLAGYEGGFTAAHLLPRTRAHHTTPSMPAIAEMVYLSQCHKQPILSLDSLPDGSTYFTSSADALIAAHHIPDLPVVDVAENPPLPREEDSSTLAENNSPRRNGTPRTNEIDTGQTLSSTLDKVNPESPQRNPAQPPSTSDKSKALEPQQHHQTPLSSPKRPPAPNPPNPSSSHLSSILSSNPAQPHQSASSFPTPISPQIPYKSISTNHAGQQSLRVRSDARLLATGGWDSRVRIYSAKTLKEVAVLKWHKEGVYAVDFGEILDAADIDAGTGGEGDEANVVRRETGLGRLQRQREEAVQMKHWVASGAKDGKVVLWEVF